MPRPTEDEKDRFLEYIRGGDDRATAAWKINPDYTGTMFRSMCNPRSTKNYDPDFALRYDEAVEIRGPLDPERQQIHSSERSSVSVTPSGFTKAMHLSEDQLDEFIDLVREGTMAFAAALELDPPTSITQIHRRAAKDPEFAREYREAKDEGYTAYKDSLRAEATRQAFAGDYRALRDQMIMHLEEAGALTTNRHEVGMDIGAIRLVAERHFADLPPELLDKMIEAVEQKELGGPEEQKELASG
jgi:hypothetical protein